MGTTISHYKIIEKLGEGGMGVVYKALDTRLDREVAIKFLPSQMTADSERKQRLINEAKTASSLDHPNICSIYEIDETPKGELFIVMRAYEGVSLDKKIETGPLPIREVVHYGIQIAAGLQAAHENGIVHRDVKSSNIIVTRKDEVKLIDFGLAKLRGGTKLTRTGKAVGSLAYMSPEQLRADEVDMRSDIFSLGVVLYEMITGDRPFKGEYDQVVAYAITNQDPTPLAVHRADIPQELERVVTRCLEKNTELRYQNAADLIDDLRKIHHAIETETPSNIAFSRVPSSKSVINQTQRYKVLVLFVIAVIFLVLSYPHIRQFVEGFTGKDLLPDDRYLAVLPFTTISDHPGDSYLSDGLMDLLTGKITQLEIAHGSLLVIPASEIRRHNITSASDANKIFGANLAVQGTVYRDEKNVHVTLVLIDSRSLVQIAAWDGVIDKEQLTELHRELIFQLSKMLEVELEPKHIAAIDRGNTINPRAYELFLEARGYLQRYEQLENISTAIELLEEAIQLDPLYSLAYASIGEAYLRKYDATRDREWIDRAVSNGTRALELNDNIASVHVTLGMILNGTGEYEKAIDSFERAIEINPINSDAFRGLARAYEQIGKSDEAENVYKQAIRLRPSYWVGYNFLGAFYYRRAQYDDAIKQYRRVTELTPDNIAGYVNLGAIYFELDQWDKAREYFEQALEFGPNYAIYYNLGTIYYYESMYEDAIHVYEQALSIHDHDYRLWGGLASAYYWADKNDDLVMETYRRAVSLAEGEKEINPRDPALLIALAGYYERLGVSEIAYKYLDDALAISRDDAYILSRAGVIYEQLGERERALQLILSALEQGHSIVYIENDPVLKELHNEPEYIKTIRNLNQ